MTTLHEPGRIRAITLDLDDTLWPIAPVIERAERALQDWLRPQAPATAGFLSDAARRLALRQRILAERPQAAHDLRALRRELLRRALQQHGEDVALVDAAYEVFIGERMRVQLYADAEPALAWLAARYPLVAVSNGNADIHRIGLGRYFRAALSAQDFGVGKPDARIFHAAAQAAGVAAQEVLHVGDDPALDIQGALGAGMHAVWVNRAGAPWPHDGYRPHASAGNLAELCRLLQPA
ncbi:MAG: HAD family hydrolase [Hylemonella sp.]